MDQTDLDAADRGNLLGHGMLRLLNPADAERDDCEYDFASRSMKESLLSLEELRRASEDPNPVYLPLSRSVRSAGEMAEYITGGPRRRLKSAYERAERFRPDDEVQ